MQPSRKFFWKLTLRLEIYINVIVLPLVFYIDNLTQHFSTEDQKAVNILAVTLTLALMIAGTGARFIILNRLFRRIAGQDDLEDVKIRLLNYPRIEVIIIIIRWFAGLLLIYLGLYAMGIAGPDRLKMLSLDILMSASTNAVISFFTTENMLSEVLRTPSLREINIPGNRYKQVSMPARILLTVYAVLLIPVVTMGVLIAYIHAGSLRIEGLYGHIAFIIAMTIVTLSVILYESTRGIRTGMRSTIENLKLLSGRDFYITNIPMLDRSEIGVISLYVNDLAESLRQFVAKDLAMNKRLTGLTVQMKKSTEVLFANTREEAATMEEISASIEELNSNSESISGIADEQSGAAVSLAGSFEELAGAIAVVERRVAEATEISGNVKTTTGESSTKLNRMVESLKTVSRSSDQMNSIIEIINDISDKINLLSLNASIEAARAGDAGRGFAVVADEISKLADMTANSIKDISGLVQRNVSEIGRALVQVDETVKAMESIATLTDSINSRINGISDQMRSQDVIKERISRETNAMKQKSDAVSTAVKEQMTALEQMSSSISYINEAIQKTALSSENLLQAAKEVDAMAVDLIRE